MKIANKIKNEYDDDSLLPLVNIIFLLLIFFMIAGVIEKRIIKDDVELPSADLNKFDNKEVTKIFINNNNEYFINDNVIEVDKINQYIKASKQSEVVIIADKSLYINDINLLLIKLHENDIKTIKLLSNRNGS